MRIVQMSDIHVGSDFRPELLEAAIEETNDLKPDLVAVAGDLTMEGHLSEFEEARSYIDRLECGNVVVIMGNHDAKNAGFRHFEDLFGMRDRAVTVSTSEGEAKVVAIDSTKPDFTAGEVGRDRYAWLDSELRGWDRGPKIVIVHHHILAVPGAGNDSGILVDAGDFMAILAELEVDMVLCGHRHVPYLWNISGVRVIHCGTVSNDRTRGVLPPSYNMIDFDPEEAHITLRKPGESEEPLGRFSRKRVASGELQMPFDKYIRYYKTPF